MDDYPPIGDHGLIGDLQTAALVTKDGSIDWLCCPRFDSPSIFGALLDHRNGGRCQVVPAEGDFKSYQMYMPGSAILITRFMTASGIAEVTDFMPPITSSVPTPNHRIVRMLRCIRGTMKFRLDVEPRFDYGRQSHDLSLSETGAVFGTKDLTLTMHPVREPTDEALAKLTKAEAGDIHATVTLEAGQTRGMVLESAATTPARAIRPEEIHVLFDQTVAFWRSWVGRSTYRGRWREVVERSAITLKLMTYHPSGALVAAPTAGLPEQVGGERNWDYRYTWIRDSSFSVYALLGLGYTEEAEAFLHWLAARLAEQKGEAAPLKIMYRVDGSSDLSEEILGHWEGYRGSSPVRIGNGASDQLQLDIYGEALDSIFFGDRRGLQAGAQGWVGLRDIINWVADNWDQPEEGIWETRGGRQPFTYGRLMCWVALDRAIRLATGHSRPAPLQRWVHERDRIYDQIMQRGWSGERAAFIQHYGSEVLDASLLRMSTVGFVAPKDPMWLSTLEAMEQELVSDSLVYRYDPSASPDGLRGSEGTFSLCSFDYVHALARSGKVDEAQLAFEKMLTYANHAGLFAEEIGQTGEQLGNFPQAFTHLALIDAAITLNDALDRGSTSLAAEIPIATAGAGEPKVIRLEPIPAPQPVQGG